MLPSRSEDYVGFRVPRVRYSEPVQGSSAQHRFGVPNLWHRKTCCDAALLEAKDAAHEVSEAVAICLREVDGVDLLPARVRGPDLEDQVVRKRAKERLHELDALPGLRVELLARR